VGMPPICVSKKKKKKEKKRKEKANVRYIVTNLFSKVQKFVFFFKRER
jgi:hypothetical protein